MLSFCRQLGLLAALILLGAAAYTQMERRIVPLAPDRAQAAEAVYLPKVEGLRALSFGYGSAVSHLLWFKTISYFGKHFRADRNYIWLDHMCQLVTALNPGLKHVQQFCGTMLAWEANKPKEGLRFFSQAIAHDPNDWLFYYLRGFTLIFFLHEDEAGQSDFVKAASLPGAHPVVVRLASKKILNSESPEAAIEFLDNVLRGTRDPQARAVLEDRLREAVYELGFRKLEAAVAEFTTQQGKPPVSLQELAEAGLAPDVLVKLGFRDAFGGVYYIDSSTGVVKSTSTRKRDSLHWKRKKPNE